MSTCGTKWTPPRVASGRACSARSFCGIVVTSAIASSPLLTPLSWTCLLRLDVDLARLGRLVLGQLDEQDAVLQPGLDLVRVHREGQRQRAAEGTEGALLAVPDAALRHARFALALERQLVAAGDIDFQ